MAPAGFVSGPMRLNAVRTPISRRVGPAWRIAGWNAGANMNANPCVAERRAGRGGVVVDPDPSASSTSAEPDRDVIARLPCLATGTPAAATTSAAVVEMLNVPRAVAAGADDVDRALGRRRPASDALAHRGGEAGELVDGLAAHPEAP